MYQEAITNLKSITLIEGSQQTIRDNISKFGGIGVIAMTLHRGKNIIRARTNGIIGEDTLEGPFIKKADFLYKPAQYNTTYQRASTPNQTMFYGVGYPDEASTESARAIATFEGSKLLRAERNGEEKISYGRFVVTEDIPLIAICYNEGFVPRSKYAAELFQNWKNAVATMPAEMQERTVATTQFLADEFSKLVLNTAPHTEYMISAIYTEMVAARGMAGVYYPSVKNLLIQQGVLFNVAITPDYAEKYLKLIAAGECTIYSEQGNIIVDNDSVVTITDDTKPFSFTKLSSPHHVGREEVYRRLRDRQKLTELTSK